MAEVSRSCGACGGTLGADDLYCPRCGTPTARKADPEATLVNPASRLSTPASPGADPEATVVNPASAPGKQPQRVSVSAFNDRLREVLDAEYELLSVLGQGGFGRVYRARDRRLDRFVAIKVIRPDLMGSNEFVDSFRNESIALAKLRHPGIVPIYDIRERGGLIYYVMPMVHGTTLEARLGRTRLPPLESRRILSELADALAAAHRSKMMHLDIKPANVFLEGELQKVLLMDFGLAKALTDQVDESAAVPVVGTPEYMSPEQARGQPDIDYRSDIYSMGVIGYRMLMGRPPFRGRDSADTLAKHINEAPVPLRELNPTIPKGLADAIMRCLAKDPWDRFPNALDLRGALEAVTFFSGSGSMTAPEDEPRMQRTLLLLIAATALLAGLVIGRMLG
ncbi:MAG TPA: serine/threonine-protein kinase [Gemmatimonadales bacterium]|nr:serine/threonine-protein kinase [Gemmatimonadales bacterium]